MTLRIGPGANPGIAVEIADLAAGERLELAADGMERCVVILSGHCSVDVPEAGLHRANLGAREDVFDGRATAVYVPRQRQCQLLGAHAGAQVAIVAAPAADDHEAYVVMPDGLHVERRGRGAWKRTVYDILGPSQPASRLLVGETFSRAGVWSGYPPHKHDREDPPNEHRFDEVFYLRVKPRSGFGVLLHYPEGAPRESATVVHDGDIIVLTEGYHSFVAAAEHELYYLWALAGGRRQLAMRTDPRHAWISQLPDQG